MNVAAAMLEVAADLTELELPATADPRAASTWNAGAVILVLPPTVDYTTRLVTWELAVLAPTQNTDLETTQKIAAVLEELQSKVPTIEEARPSSVLLARDLPRVPAYLARMTTPTQEA